MDFQGTHSWTFGGIVGSFVDLVLAYFLLCGSALAFFVSKTCNVFGLYLPCPCSGIFGYQNSDLCLHKLLVEWPLMIISYVQMLAKSRFPFNYVLCKDQATTLNKLIRGGKRGKVVPEPEEEGEASCSSFYGVSSRNLGSRESGYDTKGKRSVNLKQRSGIRRRRRVAIEYGKFSPVISPGNVRSIGAGVPISPFNGSNMTNETNQSLGPVDRGEDNLQGDGISPTSIDLSERSWYSFARSLSFDESKDGDNNTPSVGKLEGKTEDKLEIFGNDANTIRVLEQALEEEKAASAALLLELEKERAAAASATDEAMAMILRLQKDKASLEMETMQYQRLIEEKFAHDEDEMNIMKEILVRRERENHFLEMELESFRQMNALRDEQMENDLRNGTLDSEQQPDKFYCDGEELKTDRKQGDQVVRNLCGSMPVAEPTIHDVHVIDDKIEVHEEENGNSYKPVTRAASNGHGDPALTFGVLGVRSDEPEGDHSNGTETEPYLYGSGLDISGESESGNSTNKTSLYDFRRRSMSTVDSEREKIDTKIERLKEMLRIVQDGKEKLTVSVENKERESSQLELVHEMSNQLREVQHLQEPVQQASLPSLSSKASKK